MIPATYLIDNLCGWQPENREGELRQARVAAPCPNDAIQAKSKFFLKLKATYEDGRFAAMTYAK